MGRDAIDANPTTNKSNSVLFNAVAGRPLRARSGRRLARAAHGPGGLDRVERRALLPGPAVEEYLAVESLRIARKEPETAAFPQIDERPGEEFHGDGAWFCEEQMRHGRPMHADDDVRMRHGNNSRARRRGIVPVTTSIESSIAGAEECAFERGVVGEGTMRVVARVVPCEMQRSGVAGTARCARARVWG